MKLTLFLVKKADFTAPFIQVRKDANKRRCLHEFQEFLQGGLRPENLLSTGSWTTISDREGRWTPENQKAELSMSENPV